MAKRKNKKKKTPDRRQQAQTTLAGRWHHVLNRHVGWVCLGLILLGSLFCILTFTPILSTNGDNALYIVLGMSWVQGQGNSTICAPGDPPNTMVPPGFPLLLAPLIALFPNDYLPLKLLCAALFVFSLPLILLVVRDRAKSILLALLVVFFCACNLNLLYYSSDVMTEIPFLFFSLLGLYLIGRTLPSDTAMKTPKGKFTFGLAIVFLVWAYYIRAVGMVLPMALVVSLILRKRYRLAALAALVIICLLLPWVISNATGTGEQQGYLEQFVLKNAYDPALGRVTVTDMLARAIENLRTYGVLVIPGALFPSLSPLTDIHGHNGLILLLGILATLATLLGFVIQARRSITIIEIYAFLFMGICILWPQMWSGMRFLVPVIPLLIYYFLVGLWWLAQKLSAWISPLIGQLFLIIVVVIMTASSTAALARQTERTFSYPAEWQNYFQAAQWCRENTPQESICVARKPSLFYLWARRKVLNYPYTAETKEMMAFLAEKKVDYVLVDGFSWTGTTRRYLVPAIKEHPQNFQPVYQLKDPYTVVLKTVILPSQEMEATP